MSLLVEIQSRQALGGSCSCSCSGWKASPTDRRRHVRRARLQLTEEQFAQLGARLQALADEYCELSDPALPDVSLVFALFHPAPRRQAEGSVE